MANTKDNIITILMRQYNPCMENQKISDALKVLNKILSIDENNVFALARRADIYRLQERYEEACVDVAKALRLKSKDYFALSIRGEINRMIGKLKKAIDDFTDACISAQPDHVI